MEWREVLEHPSLKNLPFKIETNKWGKIMMSPASDLHGIYQSRIVRTIGRLAKEGETATECPIQTSEGVRVADVSWRSNAFLKKHGVRNLALPQAPEVVVEIESPSNCVAELEEKKQLYFEAGAREFWLCDENGNMRFFNPQGELKRSEFFGEFPVRIDIEVA
ncbi:MAG: Uma2 family endonuclease [Deltaproteobacteria bacterium]|jgi:Uma2 family endonuclease|nr:Uma2 family endonuclease [Deltaproteobacteria bacterium]MDA8307440.1 Uma2 family endonuclease [Deltaproteobacteria bacterium]